MSTRHYGASMRFYAAVYRWHNLTASSRRSCCRAASTVPPVNLFRSHASGPPRHFNTRQPSQEPGSLPPASRQRQPTPRKKASFLPDIIRSEPVQTPADRPTDTLQKWEEVVRYRSETGLMLQIAIPHLNILDSQKEGESLQSRLGRRTGARVDIGSVYETNGVKLCPTTISGTLAQVDHCRDSILILKEPPWLHEQPVSYGDRPSASLLPWDKVVRESSGEHRTVELVIPEAAWRWMSKTMNISALENYYSTTTTVGDTFELQPGDKPFPPQTLQSILISGDYIKIRSMTKEFFSRRRTAIESSSEDAGIAGNSKSESGINNPRIEPIHQMLIRIPTALDPRQMLLARGGLTIELRRKFRVTAAVKRNRPDVLKLAGASEESITAARAFIQDKMNRICIELDLVPFEASQLQYVVNPVQDTGNEGDSVSADELPLNSSSFQPHPTEHISSDVRSISHDNSTLQNAPASTSQDEVTLDDTQRPLRSSLSHAPSAKPSHMSPSPSPVSPKFANEPVSSAVEVPFNTLRPWGYAIRYRSDTGLLLQIALPPPSLNDAERKYGRNLHDIQRRSGARIEIGPQATTVDNSSITSVTLSGTFAEVKFARDLLSSCKLPDWLSQNPQPRDVRPSSSLQPWVPILRKLSDGYREVEIAIPTTQWAQISANRVASWKEREGTTVVVNREVLQSNAEVGSTAVSLQLVLVSGQSSHVYKTTQTIIGLRGELPPVGQEKSTQFRYVGGSPAPRESDGTTYATKTLDEANSDRKLRSPTAQPNYYMELQLPVGPNGDRYLRESFVGEAARQRKEVIRQRLPVDFDTKKVATTGVLRITGTSSTDVLKAQAAVQDMVNKTQYTVHQSPILLRVLRSNVITQPDLATEDETMRRVDEIPHIGSPKGRPIHYAELHIPDSERAMLRSLLIGAKDKGMRLAGLPRSAAIRIELLGDFEDIQITSYSAENVVRARDHIQKSIDTRYSKLERPAITLAVKQGVLDEDGETTLLGYGGTKSQGSVREAITARKTEQREKLSEIPLTGVYTGAPISFLTLHIPANESGNILRPVFGKGGNRMLRVRQQFGVRIDYIEEEEALRIASYS